MEIATRLAEMVDGSGQLTGPTCCLGTPEKSRRTSDPFIVLDEPTSALDVLVQARVLNLLARLRREHGLTYVFITHDLAVVRAIADRVSVFQRGQLVETGGIDEIFADPSSAYTRQLIGAVPVITEQEEQLRNQIRRQSDPVGT
jgi:ABC-type oligopeptide transport system ATPase subunit